MRKPGKRTAAVVGAAGAAVALAALPAAAAAAATTGGVDGQARAVIYFTSSGNATTIPANPPVLPVGGSPTADNVDDASPSTVTGSSDTVTVGSYQLQANGSPAGGFVTGTAQLTDITVTETTSGGTTHTLTISSLDAECQATASGGAIGSINVGAVTYDGSTYQVPGTLTSTQGGVTEPFFAGATFNNEGVGTETLNGATAPFVQNTALELSMDDGDEAFIGVTQCGYEAPSAQVPVDPAGGFLLAGLVGVGFVIYQGRRRWLSRKSADES